jgi:hypothetical protein
MMVFNQAARMTEQNLRKGEATTEQSLSQVEQTLTASVDNCRDFQLKAIEILRAHTDSAFDLTQELIAAKSPTELFEIWRSFAERQVNILQKQTGEFAAISQEVAKNTMQPVKVAVDRLK